MALTRGTRIGAYEITGSLGAGGMGEVYRAHDAKLNRDVALKILPEAFVTDAERLARFRREAQVLASLNHPNIAAIYGFEDSGATHALVLELVEGETLADRVAHGPIAQADALPIAKQIAEALEAAHELGIVHRDLKPANIKVRADGTVKVLDFGLAKAMDAPGGRTFRSGGGPAGSEDPASYATMTSPAMTAVGMVLGTAAYMSPEQARGRSVDKRADLWAFGVVLYEMLTGRRAFEGDDVSITLANVLKDDLRWDTLPPDLPSPVQRLLRRCVVKDPKQRLADASTVRLEIEDALRGPSGGADTAASARGSLGRERIAWAVAAVLGLAAIAALVVPRFSGASVANAGLPEARFTIEGVLGGGEVSPDGKYIAYPSVVGGRRRLWVRPMASATASLVGDVEFDLVTAPFWSPDSASLAYFSAQKLKRIDLPTGAVQTLADAPTPRGGAWGSDGTILFAPTGNGPIYRMPATGGATPVAVTALQAPQVSHRSPVFLPDGRHFLLLVLGSPDVRGIYVGSLDGPEITRVLEADGSVTLAGPNHVLFIREGVLYAQRLDLRTLRMTGDVVPVASGVSTTMTTSRSLSASRTGVIVFRPDVDDDRQILWVDRAGKVLETVGEPLPNVGFADLSPDRRTIAIARSTHGRSDVWLMEVTRGALTRFVTDGNLPVWSHDSNRLAFSSTQDGLLRIYWQAVNGGGSPQVVFQSQESQNPDDWSPDGKYILFSSQSPTTARDLLAMPIEGAGKSPIAVAQTPAEESRGAFSPDGAWVAYISDETGSPEVYVRPFPGPGRAVRISTKGTGTGRLNWRSDSKEIYYAIGGRVMAVPFAATGGIATVGAPVPLFTMSGFVIAAPDGKRFLVVKSVQAATPADLSGASIPQGPLTVIVNWAGREK